MRDGDAGVLFGVDYYPEQWDRALWEPDARRMREMGLRAVRLMEFAWVLLEPAEGVYDFSLFDEAVEVLARHGLQIVLGTPTATFPAWLHEKDPGLVQVHPWGPRRDFGARREACLNSETYRAAARRIVEQVARHFGSNPHVIGWQIDNEVGHEGSDRCACENCGREWPAWLARRYGDVRELNRAWGTTFWGTTYDKFEQVPVPRKQIATGHNPGLLLDYDRFCSDTARDFVAEQEAILRQHVDARQWITTNLYPAPHSTAIDMRALAEPLDFISFDNYPVWGDQDEPLPYYFTSYVLSHIRGLKDNAPFAIMEQFSGIQGHVALGYLPPEAQVVLWTHQAVARGADKIFYFRWRTAPYGQEQLCYGLLDRDNADTARSAALARNVQSNAGAYRPFAGQPFESAACLLYDKDNARVLREQYLSKGLYVAPAPFMQVGYDAELARHFAPYVLFNVNADVQSVQAADLSRYKIVSLPLYQMADPAWVDQLDAWVRAGGHLVLGWRCGTRDPDNQAVDRELPGLFAGMAGVRVRRFESLNNTKVGIRVGLLPAKGEVWADLLEPTTARPIAHYRDGKKHYSGTPCATVNEHGRGRVYYLGTSPDPLGIVFLFRRILKGAGVNPKFHGMGVEIVRRRTVEGGEVAVVLNHTRRAKRVMGRTVPAYGMQVVPLP